MESTPPSTAIADTDNSQAGITTGAATTHTNVQATNNLQLLVLVALVFSPLCWTDCAAAADTQWMAPHIAEVGPTPIRRALPFRALVLFFS